LNGREYYLSPGPVIWFCGLPGSGKSTIARGVFEELLFTNKSLRLSFVSMDSIRKKIFPRPTYSDEERDTAYRSFVLIASVTSKTQSTVILDGTGHKKVWRDFARSECPRFIEAYVKCSVQIAMKRETTRSAGENGPRKNLYVDALERLRTGTKKEGLGKVPGVDEPFEESPDSEIVLDSETFTPRELVLQTIEKLKSIAPDIFPN